MVTAVSPQLWAVTPHLGRALELGQVDQPRGLGVTNRGTSEHVE